MRVLCAWLSVLVFADVVPHWPEYLGPEPPEFRSGGRNEKRRVFEEAHMRYMQELQEDPYACSGRVRTQNYQKPVLLTTAKLNALYAKNRPPNHFTRKTRTRIWPLPKI